MQIIKESNLSFFLGTSLILHQLQVPCFRFLPKNFVPIAIGMNSELLFSMSIFFWTFAVFIVWQTLLFQFFILFLLSFLLPFGEAGRGFSWRIRESNPWPLECKSSALANWANPPRSSLQCSVSVFSFSSQFSLFTLTAYCDCDCFLSSSPAQTWTGDLYIISVAL
jgi:hypothetical protein